MDKFYGISPGEEVIIPIEKNGERIQQTCRDYEAEDRYYEFVETNSDYNWNKTSNQYRINQIWEEQGKTADPDTHWAYITTGSGEKRYLVALSSTYGTTGDYVDIYVNKEGIMTVFPCIMGDAKSDYDGAFSVDGVIYGDVAGEKLKVVEIMISNYDGTQYSHHHTPIDQTLVNNISNQLEALYPVTKIKNGGSYFDSTNGSEYLDGSYGTLGNRAEEVDTVQGILGHMLRDLWISICSFFEQLFSGIETEMSVFYETPITGF